LNPSLLSVEQALAQLLRNVEPVSIEVVPLSKALKRVLAQDIHAPMDLPPFSNSAMDGFAIRAADVADASDGNPVQLSVVGDVSAGEGDVKSIHADQAMRIMTGAVIPAGADAVVPVESTDNPQALSEMSLPEFVVIRKEVMPGDFIRVAGQDVREGNKILSCGHRLRPQDIGMLATLGISTPSVYRKPQIALISTGDELVDLAQELRPGTIRDSNRYALAAAIESSGAVPVAIGIVPDDPKQLEKCLDYCVELEVDLIVSSAGVSMGAFDFVRNVVESKGHLEFWRVNIRPGKPFLKGSYKGIPVIGLPGNPVSALVTFEIFVKPFLYHLSGVKTTKRFILMAMLKHPIETDGRESYLRAKLTQGIEGYEVGLVGSQDSGVLSSLIEANAIIRIPAGMESLAKGAHVEVLALHNERFL
jgi:molybdopterin molybdotransferase